MREHQALETKAKILETAVELVKKSGFGAVTIRDICDAADISIGAFYHHFASKQELARKSFMSYDEALKKQLHNYGDADPLDSLKKVLLDQTKYITDQSLRMVVEYYREILSAEDKNAVNPDREYYRAVYHYVDLAISRGLFRNGYSTAFIAEFLIKYIRGNIIDWCLHDGSRNVVAEVEAEIDVLLGAFVLCRADQCQKNQTPDTNEFCGY